MWFHQWLVILTFQLLVEIFMTKILRPMSVLDFVLVTKSCLIAGKVNKKHCTQYLQFLQQAAAAAGTLAVVAAVKRNPDAGSRQDKYWPMHDLSSQDKCNDQEKWTLNTLKTHNVRGKILWRSKSSRHLFLRTNIAGKCNIIVVNLKIKKSELQQCHIRKWTWNHNL